MEADNERFVCAIGLFSGEMLGHKPLDKDNRLV